MATKTVCEGTTAKGKRCKRAPKKGEKYCHSHVSYGITQLFELESQPQSSMETKSCEGPSATGKRCQKYPQKGKTYCYHHVNDETTPASNTPLFNVESKRPISFKQCNGINKDGKDCAKRLKKGSQNDYCRVHHEQGLFRVPLQRTPIVDHINHWNNTIHVIRYAIKRYGTVQLQFITDRYLEGMNIAITNDFQQSEGQKE